MTQRFGTRRQLWKDLPLRLATFGFQMSCLAADSTRFLAVRALCDGMRGGATCVALRRLRTLSCKVAEDATVVARLPSDGVRLPRRSRREHGLLHMFLDRACLLAALGLEVAHLATGGARFLAVRTFGHGVRGGAARVALRRLGALPGEMAQDTAVVARLRLVVIRCGSSASAVGTTVSGLTSGPRMLLCDDFVERHVQSASHRLGSVATSAAGGNANYVT
eukprot:CAMPEP_0195577622 /NCGR_PEP_ID=MMETSP0814-20130614/10691_1 /TAXON_ID=97485 /ORGANISM="Prymnesium parvum, Strain Texoma1" /LENGTH=220 /DNA_ID=CAMNT_0040714037 /DNA_START=250 /DNA_END=909 /DNA_ORIENTATION=+